MTKKLIVVLLVLSSCQVFGAQVADGVNIISRAEWGAKEAKGPIEDLPKYPPNVIIEYETRTDPCTTQADCQKIVKSVQNEDMDKRNLPDIRFNFLVGEDGNIYEGRGWDKRGATDDYYDERSIAIAIIGNYDDRDPNAAARKAVENFIKYAKSIGKLYEHAAELSHLVQMLLKRKHANRHKDPVVGPNIIPRAEWGAREPNGPLESFSLTPPTYVMERQTGTDICTTKAECQKIVKSIQDDDMDKHNLHDIRYNFLIGEDGNVYEGRGWKTRGEDSTDYHEKIVIGLIGRYETRDPNKAATEAMDMLIKHAKSINNLDNMELTISHLVKPPVDLDPRR